MHRLVVLLLAGLVLPAGCDGDSSSGSGGSRPALLVSAATSLKAAFTAYGDAFGRAEVKFSFAGSDALAAQIRRGVAPDVFASADVRLPAALHAEGLVERPVAFAANRLVLAVPPGSRVTELGDLASERVDVVLGSQSVPVGAYARRLLARLPAGLGARILARVRSSEPDAAGIVGKLAHGGADAGLLYATDVAATDGALRAIELPDGLRPRVTYGVAVVEGARQPAEARAFVDGLLGAGGRRALSAAGFEPPPGR